MHATHRAQRLLVLPFILAITLMATLFVATPDADAALTRNERVKKAMRIAVAQKGDPYRYGAAGPDAFDCSGLMYFSFRRAGFSNVPRTSSEQAGFTKRIKRSKMRRGDFVFFHDNGRVYHVGVFAGWKDGRRYIVHSPYGGKRVHRARIWSNNWFPGTLRNT